MNDESLIRVAETYKQCLSGTLTALSNKWFVSLSKEDSIIIHNLCAKSALELETCNIKCMDKKDWSEAKECWYQCVKE